ncbi:MAG: bifunctional ornithine acetyltransferase/N-acetylglutamate synthase [Brevinema sp.]
MVEIQRLEEGIVAVQGFRATGVSCGLKTGGSKDISLLFSDTPCNTAMAFTKNKIQGAHIALDKERINQPCQALLINSGNANCLTGKEGLGHAHEMIETVAELLKIPTTSCLLASTGPIGIPLNMTRVKYGIERLVNVIPNESNLRNFCSGISTSDTRYKNLAYRFKLGDDYITIGATAKGESMLKPWMETMQATLLIVITTDAHMTSSLLEKALAKTLDQTVNRISVDNDTSPNDSIFLLANGLSEQTIIDSEQDSRFEPFVEVLQKILLDISKLLLKQGLGTTRLLNIQIKNAPSLENAESLTRALAESYQVKAGFFGQKIPWQKMVNVIASHTDDFDLEKLILTCNNLILFEKGQANTAQIATMAFDMTALEVSVVVDLQNGQYSRELWTCDLTHDYLKFSSLLADQY